MKSPVVMSGTFAVPSLHRGVFVLALLYRDFANKALSTALRSFLEIKESKA